MLQKTVCVKEVKKWFDKKKKDFYTKENIEKVQDSSLFYIATNTVSGFFFGGTVGLLFSVASIDQKKDKNQKTVSYIGNQTWSSAKSFAFISAVNSTGECVIEKMKTKPSVLTSTLTGCITGGISGLPRGKNAVLASAATFGLFSGFSHYLENNVKLTIQ